MNQYGPYSFAVGWLDKELVHTRFKGRVHVLVLLVSCETADEWLLLHALLLKILKYAFGSLASVALWHTEVHQDELIHRLTNTLLHVPFLDHLNCFEAVVALITL